MFKAFKNISYSVLYIFCEFIVIQKAFENLLRHISFIAQIIDVMHVFIDELHFDKKNLLFFNHIKLKNLLLYRF